MAVRVLGLTKIFGSQRAVDRLGFQVNPGVITGFLGPNGAGKSTTLKMLTGYLRPSEGSAEIGGYDVQANLRQVRRLIGYLPENNPLYTDMYVREYLRICAGFYGMKQPDARIREVIDMVGLSPECHKKIGALSKGYRQRVGLAQAILHDPPVLILDEPTTGLDPNQLVEIRDLIRRLGKEKTLLFSTHILQEAAAMCDRVLVIHRGRLQADDTIPNLQDSLQGGWVTVVTFENPYPAASLGTIEGIRQVKQIDPHTLEVHSHAGTDIRPALFRFAAAEGVVIVGMEQSRRSMEEIFQLLTPVGPL